MRIGLDFDGVLNSYVSGYQGPEITDLPVPGALEFVNWLVDNGATCVIITARVREENDDHCKGVESWLKKHGFPEMKVTGKKMPCLLYLDDRGLRFTGDFDEVKDFLKAGLDPGSWVEHPGNWVANHTLMETKFKI